MWLAYLLVIYLIILSIVYYANYDKIPERVNLVVQQPYRDKIYLALAFSPLLFLACFRGEGIGSDTPQYYSYYEIIRDAVGVEGFGAVVSTRLEPGFIFLIKILTLFFDSPQALLITSALFFYFSFIRVVVKYSVFPWISVIMFFSLNFNGSMNVIRQYIAIGILTFAFEYILDKRKLKFVLSVLLATMFHYTAIVFLVAYYFRDKRISHDVIKKFYIYLPIVAVLSFVLLNIVLNFVHSFGLYDYYNDENAHIAGGIKIASFVELMFALFVVFVSCRAWGGEKDYAILNDDKVNRLLFWFSLIGAGFVAMSFPFTLISRMGTFFAIFNTLLLPNALFEISKNRNIRFLSVLVCMLYCSYYLVVNTIRPDWTFIYPYTFCW